MNRKLHNTVTALFATGGLLALSLVAGRPVELPAPATAQVAAIEAAARIEAQGRGLDTLAARATALQAALDPTEDHGPRPVRHARRGRQSVAMPFFSFFPKG